jgi:hypothetical protein
MRQLGVRAGSSANPKLTHGAEMQTNHPVEALEALHHAAAGVDFVDEFFEKFQVEEQRGRRV